MFNSREAGKSITEVRIIEAAARLFARQGFKGSSTREIAHLAQVNDATLFRYFVNKLDLFRAATESRLNRLRLGREVQRSLAEDEDPELVVPMIAAFFVESVLQQPELARLLYVAATELPGAERMFHEHLGPIFDAINGYFRRSAAKGMIDDCDSSLATFGLVGVIWAHCGLSQLFTGREFSKVNAKKETAAYARLWLQALRRTMPERVGPANGVIMAAARREP